MTWRPPLTGDSAERAHVLVDRLVSQLEVAHFGPAGSGVASGPAGLALFLAYVAKERKDGELSKRAARTLIHALRRDMEPRDASLLSGFAGIMWLLQHLPGLAGDGTAVLEHADRTIHEALSDPHWKGPFYHAEGLIGFGVYLLERSINPLTERSMAQVVHHLDRLAIEDGGGVAWLRSADSFPPFARPPTDVFDLGMPRGVAGAIAFLSAASRRAATKNVALPLLRRAVDWLLEQQTSTVPWGRFGARRQPGGRPQPPARLGWCYGDLGISVALLAASRALYDAQLENFAIELALLTTTRRGTNTEIDDAAFCHGAGGAAHLYGRLHQATADVRFLDAARYWFEAVISMYDSCNGAHGFSTHYITAENPTFHRYSDPGLLMGSAGIGLMLLSACRSIEPNWDRFLLITLGEDSLRHEDGSRASGGGSPAALVRWPGND
jgi:lantibiotic modifying enzyme